MLMKNLVLELRAQLCTGVLHGVYGAKPKWPGWTPQLNSPADTPGQFGSSFNPATAMA